MAFTQFLMLNYFSSIAQQEKMIGVLVRLPQSLPANEHEFRFNKVASLFIN